MELQNDIYYILFHITFKINFYKGCLLKHRYNYAKGYLKIDYFDRHFVLKWTRLALTNR